MTIVNRANPCQNQRVSNLQLSTFTSMRFRLILLLLACMAAAAIAGIVRHTAHDAHTTVREHELALAASMAARDFGSFKALLADEVIFMAGADALRGKAQVIGGWRRHFDGAQAPFSWQPDQIEVVESGTLAYTSGPLRGPDGRPIGRFNAVWRLDAPGQWRIVFNRGCDCDD